jgi:hypothetical protein
MTLNALQQFQQICMSLCMLYMISEESEEKCSACKDNMILIHDILLDKR